MHSHVSGAVVGEVIVTLKFSLMFALFQRAEEDAHAFLDKELKKLWGRLFLHYPQCSESQGEEEGVVVDGKKEEQRRRAIEGVVDITKLCLMEMNQEDLADALWSGKRLLFWKQRRDSYFGNREETLYSHVGEQ